MNIEDRLTKIHDLFVSNEAIRETLDEQQYQLNIRIAKHNTEFMKIEDKINRLRDNHKIDHEQYKSERKKLMNKRERLETERKLLEAEDEQLRNDYDEYETNFQKIIAAYENIGYDNDIGRVH